MYRDGKIHAEACGIEISEDNNTTVIQNAKKG
jgi:hypothetical protein